MFEYACLSFILRTLSAVLGRRMTPYLPLNPNDPIFAPPSPRRLIAILLMPDARRHIRVFRPKP